MTSARLGMLALAMALIAPAATSAQDYLPAGEDVHERLLEISPLLGVFQPDGNSNYEGLGKTIGLRIGLNNSPRWGVEAYGSFTAGLEQEQRTGQVRSYDAQPTFDTSGRQTGWVITNVDRVEGVERTSSNLLTLGGDIVLHLSEGRFRPFLLGGGGFIDDVSNKTENPPGPFSNLFFDLGFGIKYNKPSGMYFRLELRDVIFEKSNLPRENPGAWLAAIQTDLFDREGGVVCDPTGEICPDGLPDGGVDGVVGQEPYSPDAPRGLRWLHNIGVNASVTIPYGWAWRDGDGDGVATRFDKCPATAIGVVVDEFGCGIDSDQDGVFDGLDQCPDTPIGATVDELTGCSSDTDGDGVLDGLDLDDTTPKGATVDAQGRHRDTDGDGIFDGLDKCPDTPVGIAVDEEGCAKDEVERRLLEGETIAVSNVRFELGTSEIEPLSYHYINRAAQLIEHWTGDEERPAAIEIGVYSDGIGTPESNRQLTQRQADKIRIYLLENFPGIGANNLTAKGYGESDPVASDDTAEGREKNRRVVYRRIGDGASPESYDFGASAARAAGTVAPPSDLPDIEVPDAPELPDALPEPKLPDPNEAPE
ncbi:MAG: OmpA family protein [bacterium]